MSNNNGSALLGGLIACTDAGRGVTLTLPALEQVVEHIQEQDRKLSELEHEIHEANNPWPEMENEILNLRNANRDFKIAFDSTQAELAWSTEQIEELKIAHRDLARE